MINPLAIGVTLGGRLLDVLVPKPKPRVGIAQEPLPSPSRYRFEDTSGPPQEQHLRPPLASGLSQ